MLQTFVAILIALVILLVAWMVIYKIICFVVKVIAGVAPSSEQSANDQSLADSMSFSSEFAVHISRANFCLNCDFIFSGQVCPSCRSTHFHPISHWLNRGTDWQNDLAVRVRDRKKSLENQMVKGDASGGEVVDLGGELDEYLMDESATKNSKVVNLMRG